MMHLLYHESTTDSTVDTPENALGMAWPARHYRMEGHFLAVDGGGDPLVAWHDAEDICKIEGYRMATPQEQNDYAEMKRQQSALVEQTKPRARRKG